MGEEQAIQQELILCENGHGPISVVVPKWAEGIEGHAVPTLRVVDDSVDITVQSRFGRCVEAVAYITGDPPRVYEKTQKGYRPSVLHTPRDWRSSLGRRLHSSQIWHPHRGSFVDRLQYQQGMGCVYKDPQTGQLHLISSWVRTEDQEGFALGFVPDYAVRTLKVAARDLAEDQRLLQGGKNIRDGSCGSEFEMVAAAFSDGEMRLVDVQSVIYFLSEKSDIPITIEGWVSQFEQPTVPRLVGEAFDQHRYRTAENLYRLHTVLKAFGLRSLPCAVIPGDGNEFGQANFESPHVMHVLTQGIEASLGREVSIQEAADILAGYRTNGLHITIGLAEDEENGLVGDERLNRVYNATHGRVCCFLKALTHSGNLKVWQSINQTFSERDRYRVLLPTATLGPVIRLSEACNGIVQGSAPSLERAALLNADGVRAGAAHNLLGRQKEAGRIEFTFFDAEPNVDKVLAIETLMNLFVTSIDKAFLMYGDEALHILARELNWSDYEINTFLGNITGIKEYFALAAPVDQGGLDAEFDFGDEGVKSVRGVIEDFVFFVETLADRMGVLSENASVAGQLDFLVRTTATQNCPSTFEEYFDPYDERYGVGNIAMVARNVYNRKLDERMAQRTYSLDREDMQEVFVEVLEELAIAYELHLNMVRAHVRVGVE